VELKKTVVRADADGRVEQFTLRVGDILNLFMPNTQLALAGPFDPEDAQSYSLSRPCTCAGGAVASTAVKVSRIR
jgi:hypothetical protein